MEATQILRWQVSQSGTASRARPHGGVEPLPVLEEGRVAVRLLLSNYGTLSPGFLCVVKCLGNARCYILLSMGFKGIHIPFGTVCRCKTRPKVNGTLMHITSAH